MTEYKSAQQKGYLRLLSYQYPNRQAVLAEIINLQAILNLPKGTEHFMSDLHGEYDSFLHIMNNCSGVIREKISLVFDLSQRDQSELCTLVYYPKEKLSLVKENGSATKEWYLDTLKKLMELARFLSSKYTRSKVRKALPKEYAYILDELLHAQKDEDDNRQRYHSSILESIIQTDTADDFICALCKLLKQLAVDHLHIVGDIFDRGPHPDNIIEILSDYHSLDIEWGNHDVLWMGAASGSIPCIANVIRNCIRYQNYDVLEKGYGISLRKLALFAENYYEEEEGFSAIEQAITVILLKVEGQCIQRHPEYRMENRLFLHRIDQKTDTVIIEGRSTALSHNQFPTVHPSSPYELTKEESSVLDDLRQSFLSSKRLQEQIDFLYQHGSIYKVYNGNLMFHGCIPLDEHGNFEGVLVENKLYQGKAMMDFADSMVRLARRDRAQNGLDFMWYLWCAKNSPLSGREIKIFERTYCKDKILWEEPKNAYYTFCTKQTVCLMILHEFGLYAENSHIINGHTPVHVIEGESPIKADGRLIVIDGGFCRAYQSQTGIAGYTLIYNSHGMRIKAHRPFLGISSVLKENLDIDSDSFMFEKEKARQMVCDTDAGIQIAESISELEKLLTYYYQGILDEKFD